MKLALRARAKRRGHQRMCSPPAVAPPRGQFTYSTIPPKTSCSREKRVAPTAMAGGSNPEESCTFLFMKFGQGTRFVTNRLPKQRFYKIQPRSILIKYLLKRS